MATQQKLIGVKVSEEIHEKFEIAAKKRGFETVSAWLRDVGTRASTRSWGNIDPGERGALWKEHKSRGAVLPDAFNEWPNNERIAWMDKTFPLGAV